MIPALIHRRGYAARQTDITMSRSQRCAGSASMRGCHVADIMNPGIGTESSKLSRPDVASWSLPRLLPRHERGTSATKSDWRAIRIASGYPGTTTSIALTRPSFSKASSTDSMTFPSRDATTWLQAAYRSGVTPGSVKRGCPARATPTSLSWNRNWVRISGADVPSTPISRSISPSRSGRASLSGLGAKRRRIRGAARLMAATTGAERNSMNPSLTRMVNVSSSEATKSQP